MMKKQFLILAILAGLFGFAISAYAGMFDRLSDFFQQKEQTFGGTTLFPGGGGTGTSTPPTYGKLLVGNSGGTYTLTATSSLGISGTTYTATYPITLTGTAFGIVATSSMAIKTSDLVESGSLFYTDARSRAAISSSATGLTYTSATGDFSLTSGYNIPTTANETLWNNKWDLASSTIPVNKGGTGAITITGCLTGNGTGAITGSGTCNVSNATVSSITAGAGLMGGVITTSGTLYGQVSTSSIPTINPANLAYWTGVGNGTTPAKLGSVATTTLTGTAPIVFSNAISVIGGTASAVSCTAASLSVTGCLANTDFQTFNNKIGTSSNATAGRLAYFTTTNGVPALIGDVATSSLTSSNSLISISNSPSIIGSASAITLPLTKGWFIVGDDSNAAQATSTIFISSTGNVGIGTTSPYALLSISNSRTTTANTPLLTIASTTAGTATSTLLTVLANGNVGIGTTGPASSLDIRTSTNLEGLIVINSKTSGTKYGIDIGVTGTGDSNNAAYFDAYGGTINNALVTYRGNVLLVSNSGNVGIGNSNPLVKLDVEGTAECDGSGCWAVESDIVYKKNIVDLDYGLNEILQIKPKRYVLKETDENSFGLIAQDLEKIIPELVRGEEGNKSIGYDGLTPVLVKAIQEQQKQIDALKGMKLGSINPQGGYVSNEQLKAEIKSELKAELKPEIKQMIDEAINEKINSMSFTEKIKLLWK